MTEMQVIRGAEQLLAPFDPLAAELEELRKHNATAVFDYASAKGNKEARSHVYKLRQTKAAVDKVRKQQKADVLEVGRATDGKAKELVEAIDEMIAVHETPLKEIEERAKAAEALRAKLAGIQTRDMRGELLPTEVLVALRDEIEAIKFPDGTTDELAATCADVLNMLEAAIAEGEQRDLEAAEQMRKQAEERAELERLRAEAVERERKDAEAARIREAEEKARAAAEEKARLAVLEAERATQRAQEDAQRAERQKAEAEARAERAAEEAREQAERNAEAKRQAEDAATRKREADRAHMGRINNEVVDGLLAHTTLEKGAAVSIVIAIARGQIPHVKIIY